MTRHPARPSRTPLAVAALLLAATCTLTACTTSNTTTGPSPSIPTLTTTPGTSDQGTGTPTGTPTPADVSPQALSTDRYQVTSVPDNLTTQQTTVLRDFITYDQVTWNIWFTGTGIESAPAVATGQSLTDIQNNYAALPAGDTVDGTVRVAVTSVEITNPDPPNPTAQVTICADQSDLVARDANGQDISNPDTLQGRYTIVDTLTFEDGTWKAVADRATARNECGA